MKLLQILIIGALFFYFALLLIFILAQKRLTYPAPTTPLLSCDLPQGVDFFEETQSDTELKGIYHKAGQNKLLIFFHGNGEGACSWRYLGKNHVSKQGFDTLVMEYPGYSGLAGKPSKKANFAMVNALATWLETQNYEDIAIMGFSLGTGMASELAPKLNTKTLILLAPYDRMRRVVRDIAPFIPNFLISENYQNDIALQNFKAKVTIIHGAKDPLIRPVRSEVLAASLQNVERIIRENRGHDDLFDDEFINWLLDHTLSDL